MAINPELITTIRVDQLPDGTLNLTNKIPHTSGTVLEKASVQELVDLVATAIGVSGGVGYIAISVTDGQQLPDVPELPSFFLCGAGTFLNINGYPDIICTENLNAIMSLTDHWELAVEIPINPLSGTVQSVTGSAVDNTDPLNPVINEIIFGVQNIIAGTNISVDNTDPANPIVSATGGAGTPTLQEVLDNNHDLVDGNNFQGSSAGDNNTGMFVNAFGQDAANANTGTLVNALGTEAAIENTGGNVNALGNVAAGFNTGNNVNAFGDNAGNGNTFNNVNLFGTSATADDNGQTVLSKDGTIMARISTENLTATHKYNLPDTDGTLALTSDITTPTLQEVTDIGNETTNAIKVHQLVTQTSGGTKTMTLSSNNVEEEHYAEWQNKDYVGIADITDIIPQVNSDWNATSGVAEILNKPTIPDTSTLVPYTGANANVDLGEFELKAGQLTLDTTPTGTAAVTTTRWNDTSGVSETTLKGGSVILKNGVDLVARVVNKVSPNTTLTKAAYQVVKVSGAQGQRLAVDLARANNDLNSADTLGIVTETIAANQEGFIITVGQLEGINTTGSLQSETWADGDVLYLSPTTAGAITNIKPNGSNGHIVVLGYVEYAHSVNGKIYVKIMNGWELDELHNVYISSVANNQGLVYETSTQLWKNKTIIEDSITDGVTDKAPSQNAVFAALALKQNILSYSPYKSIKTSQTVLTGTTAETVIFTTLIPAGTFNSNDVIKVLFGANKTTALGTYVLRLRINTTNTISGAPTIAYYSGSTTAQVNVMMRNFNLNNGNLYGFPFLTTSMSDIVAQGASLSSTTLNPANQFYIFATINLNNASDSIIGNMLSITN